MAVAVAVVVAGWCGVIRCGVVFCDVAWRDVACRGVAGDIRVTLGGTGWGEVGWGGVGSVG